MKLSRNVLAMLATLAVAACGGGNDGATPSAATAEAQWESSALDIDGVSVGSTTIRSLDVRNDGAAAADFSRFDGLPPGMTASGCANVEAGASCKVVLTYTPTAVEQISTQVEPVGIKTGYPLKLHVNAVAAELRAVAIQERAFESDANGYPSQWSGSLDFVGVGDVPMVLKEVLIVTARDQSSASCSITVMGAYPTQFAGRHLRIGEIDVKVPAEGAVDTAHAQTTTTFTQPLSPGLCDRGYEVGPQPVLMV